MAPAVKLAARTTERRRSRLRTSLPAQPVRRRTPEKMSWPARPIASDRQLRPRRRSGGSVAGDAAPVSLSVTCCTRRTGARLKAAVPVLRLRSDVVEAATTTPCATEYAKDGTVFTDDELAALDQKSDQSVEIEQFVPNRRWTSLLRQGVPRTRQGAYKPYRLLLAAAMRKAASTSGEVLDAAQAATSPATQAEQGLVLRTLFYADEVRSFIDVDLGDEGRHEARRGRPRRQTHRPARDRTASTRRWPET